MAILIHAPREECYVAVLYAIAYMYILIQALREECYLSNSACIAGSFNFNPSTP